MSASLTIFSLGVSKEHSNMMSAARYTSNLQSDPSPLPSPMGIEREWYQAGIVCSVVLSVCHGNHDWACHICIAWQAFVLITCSLPKASQSFLHPQTRHKKQRHKTTRTKTESLQLKLKHPHGYNQLQFIVEHFRFPMVKPCLYYGYCGHSVSTGHPLIYN